MAYQATTGIGIPCKVALTTASTVSLSLSGTNTLQLVPSVTDIAGTQQSAVSSFTYISYQPLSCSVSGSGLITGLIKGQVIIEVSYPYCSNTCGVIASTGNVMNGTPIDKIVKRTLVKVGA